VILYARFSSSLRKVENLLHESGIDLSHELRLDWWGRFM